MVTLPIINQRIGRLLFTNKLFLYGYVVV